MIEIELPKDITRYEAKIAGVATMRTVVCVGIGGSLAALVKFGICDKFGLTDIQTPLMLLTVIIPCSFMIHPYGMKMEEFLASVVTTYFLAPQKRKYKTENTIESEFKQIVKREKRLISVYDKNHNIKHNIVRNDPKDKPQKKVFKGKPEYTGYL